jgi:hypothetical protein
MPATLRLDADEVPSQRGDRVAQGNSGRCIRAAAGNDPVRDSTMEALAEPAGSDKLTPLELLP